jgi:hypothetical protein
LANAADIVAVLFDSLAAIRNCALVEPEDVAADPKHGDDLWSSCNMKHAQWHCPQVVRAPTNGLFGQFADINFGRTTLSLAE